MAVHVLYADDEPALRELVQNHLSLEGYEVETAGDGAEAIRILEKTRIDLAILDIHMPNVDGIEVLKYMKSHGIKSRLIVLTGDGDPHVVSECAKYGALDYLTKPYNYHELVEAIERVLAENPST
jgi:two-component system OmpR family response regulator